MPNVANAKIYKLVNNIDDKIYVGSTCSTLSTRKSVHKCMSKIHSEIKLYKHLNQVGWDNVTIELIEAYGCESKEELYKRERYWIETLKSDLNTNRPIRSSEEKRDYHKDYSKEHHKDYYEKHKEKIKKYSLEYYEKHKEVMNDYNKDYRELNREKLTKQHTCECGGRYTHHHKSTHIKTKKHLKYIETKNISEIPAESTLV